MAYSFPRFEYIAFSNFCMTAYYEKTLVHIMMNQRFCILLLFIFLLLTYGNVTPRQPYH